MKIKNWEKFQQYKDRNPYWIKVYRDLLNDPDWFALEDGSVRFLVNLWLIASEHGKDGTLPDIRRIALRLHKSVEYVASEIIKLSHWVEGSTEAYGSVQICTTEKENREQRTEKERERESRAKARPPRKTQLPSDWWPSDGEIDFARTTLGSPERVDVEIEKFRDYWIGVGKPMANWGRTFRNWVRRAKEFSANAEVRYAKELRRAESDRALAKLRAFAYGEDHGDVRGQILPLLPKRAQDG